MHPSVMMGSSGAHPTGVTKLTQPAEFDVSSQATETAAVATIRSMTPLCFQNVLSKECDKAIDDCSDAERTNVSIDPLIGSIHRRKHPEGVQFSMHGRLHAGEHRRIDVIVHGVNTPEGLGLISVERAYDRSGKPTPRFYEQTPYA